jgi:hypothetical protein
LISLDRPTAIFLPRVGTPHLENANSPSSAYTNSPQPEHIDSPAVFRKDNHSSDDSINSTDNFMPYLAPSGLMDSYVYIVLIVLIQTKILEMLIANSPVITKRNMVFHSFPTKPMFELFVEERCVNVWKSVIVLFIILINVWCHLYL